jgi:hypothetical protein
MRDLPTMPDILGIAIGGQKSGINLTEKVKNCPPECPFSGFDLQSGY